MRGRNTRGPAAASLCASCWSPAPGRPPQRENENWFARILLCATPSLNANRRAFVSSAKSLKSLRVFLREPRRRPRATPRSGPASRPAPPPAALGAVRTGGRGAAAPSSPRVLVLRVQNRPRVATRAASTWTGRLASEGRGCQHPLFPDPGTELVTLNVHHHRRPDPELSGCRDRSPRGEARSRADAPRAASAHTRPTAPWMEPKAVKHPTRQQNQVRVLLSEGRRQCRSA